ncbi:sodium:solute symporter family protein [Candidatus Bandiella euplotis]|uniref:Sodium:solute symporter family protein n=1 Tax=Candidatus Bandiella euplotis TaxID=1664265 RepID=A0ABZ0UJA9_9RICK|nr:sodium:solute symporter family protein [Candidatus Bandiella woodruffii]WPX96191.1 Sodium:solute symporter family protein [Candidatus Bandiella woodruffii]
MNYYLLVLLVASLGALSFFGYRSAKKIKNYDNYFLAGRQLGIFSVCVSLLATQIGGGVILGTSQASYKYGIYGIFYTFGLSLGLIAVAFFGAKQLREKNVATVAELFEKEYNSVFLKKIASIISITSLYGILISLIISTKGFLVAFGMKNDLILYAFWVILLTYTILGGIRAVVYINMVKITLIFIVFTSVIAYYAIERFEFLQFSLDSLLVSIKPKGEISFSDYIIVPFLFVFIEQDMAQNFFAAKNTKVAYISAFLAGVLLLLFSFIPVIFGVAARSIGNIPDGANEMMFFFTQTSNGFVTLATSVATLCAILSTGDALLCAISSNLALDFKTKSKNSLLHTRIITIALGVGAIALAHYFNDIIKIMLISYEVMVCTLFLPIVTSYFNFKNTTAFAYISIILGIVGFISYQKFVVLFEHNISREIFCILLALFAFPLSRVYTLSQAKN